VFASPHTKMSVGVVRASVQLQDERETCARDEPQAWFSMAACVAFAPLEMRERGHSKREMVVVCKRRTSQRGHIHVEEADKAEQRHHVSLAPAW
jgi:hypothetical protein